MEDKYRFFPLNVVFETQEYCHICYLEEEYYAKLKQKMLAHTKDANGSFTAFSLDALAEIITSGGGKKYNSRAMELQREIDKTIVIRLGEEARQVLGGWDTEKLKNNPWYRRGKSGKKLRY